MKKIIASICLLAIGMIAFGQDYELKDSEYKGQIIDKKGNVRQGYVDMKGNEMTPWKNQQSLKFFSEEAVADGKVKGKEKEKYKPKDITAYIADGRYFETVKISASKLTIGVGIASYRFVERLLEGEVSLYRLYEAPDPAGVYVGDEAIAAHKEELERMRNNPLKILKKQDGDFIKVTKVNLAEYLEECPSVVEKYNTGGYGIEPWIPKKGKKLAGALAKSANAERMEAVLPEILGDYNTCK